jgi:hypothetical protein
MGWLGPFEADRPTSLLSGLSLLCIERYQMINLIYLQSLVEVKHGPRLGFHLGRQLVIEGNKDTGEIYLPASAYIDFTIRGST